jgi:5-formyltetrahydrofolate cyclo-ligase
MTPEQAKAKLRADLRTRRSRMRAMVPDAPHRAADHFRNARLGPFKVAAIYKAMGAELDCEPLCQALSELGCQIALPVVVQRDSPLVFRVRRHADQLEPDLNGVLAPPPSAPEVRPDLVIVPLLAFDGTGARLGQGAGYYDRTLEKLRGDGGPVMAVGLAYAGQELPHIPIQPHDQRVDAMLTEHGYRPVQKVS